MAGIYIHIPFCNSKCHYCNFFSVASLKYKNQIVEKIIQEISFKHDLISEPVDTVYFGGGTPSILMSSEIEKIINTIYKNFSLNSQAEVTLEANPEHINLNNLTDWKRNGINRLSIGIQSLNTEILHNLNREHSGLQALKSIEIALSSGFSNISCDLIFGIPGQTDEMLLSDLETFTKLQIPHISAYSLTVEEKTALSVLIRQKKYPKTSDNQSIKQFYLCSDFLRQHGYEHYEISNYSKPDMYAKHNTNYWKQVPYLGFGPSAHSFHSNKRCWNFASISKYLNQIESIKYFEDFEIIDEVTHLNEYLLLGLRTQWGIDLEYLKNNFQEFYDSVFNLLKVEIDKDNLKMEGNRVTITHKSKIISDGIISNLLLD